MSPSRLGADNEDGGAALGEGVLAKWSKLLDAKPRVLMCFGAGGVEVIPHRGRAVNALVRRRVGDAKLFVQICRRYARK
jgi:hypothetical protein